MGKLKFHHHYIIILGNIIFSLLRIVVISVMDLFVLYRVTVHKALILLSRHYNFKTISMLKGNNYESFAL